jgi:hypothetical protein
MAELLELAGEVKARFGRQVVVNVTPFVPKAHTPFQRQAMAGTAALDARLRLLRDGCRRLRVDLRAEPVREARIQGVLARGGERVAEVLLGMERPTPRAFERALEVAGLRMDDELGARAAGVALPWDRILVGSGRAGDWAPGPEDEACDG